MKRSDCHQLVTATARLFKEVKSDEERAARGLAAKPWAPGVRRPLTRFGRYTTERLTGVLQVSATLRHMDWILQFHDDLLHALEDQGFRTLTVGEGRYNWVYVERDGEKLSLTFTEKYERKPNPKAGPGDRWTYVSRDTFTLHVRPELHSGVVKQWTGNADRLERVLPEIISTVAAAPAVLAEERRLWREGLEHAKQRREEHRQAEANLKEQQELARQRKTAREDQVVALREAMVHAEQRAQMLEALEHMEARADDASNPSAVTTWVQVVRSELEDPWAPLLDRISSDCTAGLPLWWPFSTPVK
jgi:hypothetical protein